LTDSNITSPPYFSSDLIIAKYGINDKIESYLQEILLYNEKVNLVSRETSIEDLKTIAVDSLVPFEFAPSPDGHIFDIGPGAGFPSIVVLLAFPDLCGLLIERTQKKIVFLRKTIDIFRLDAEIIHADFAEAKRNIKFSSFNTGLMKLVRPDPNLLQNVADILKPGGFFIYYADLNDKTIVIPARLEMKKYKYFLDKHNQVRTITILKKTS